MLILVFDTQEDKDQFITLYEKYGKYVMYTVNRYIKDEYMAEDLFQETLIILADHIRDIDFSNDIKVRNYVITITKNYCLNYLDKQRRSKETLAEDMEQLNHMADAPLDWVLQKEAHQKLCEAIEKLDTKYRTAFELKYVNDLDDDSIAKILGISRKNAQMRVYRAKLKLREVIMEAQHG